MQIECPSGLKGEVRRFGGRVIQAIADGLEDDDVLSDNGMSQVLSSVWQETLDPGPYPFMSPGETKPPWRRLLRGDVISALLMIRVGSFRDGNEYHFPVQCPTCKRRFPWTIDLQKHMFPRVRGLSEEGLAHIRDGATLHHTMDNGTDVAFQLATTERSEPVVKFVQSQLKRKQRKSEDTTLLDQLTIAVTGIDGKPATNVRHRWEWIQKQDLQDLYDLRDAIEAHTCGLDTEITVQCTHNRCRWEFDVDLPFAPSFLDPARLSRRERLFGPTDPVAAPTDDDQGASASDTSPTQTAPSTA